MTFAPFSGQLLLDLGINVGFQPKNQVVFTLPLTTDYVEHLSFSGFKILFARYKTGNVRPYI